MIRKMWINESFRLSNIEIFFKKPVQECNLHIHLVKLELQVTSQDQENPNGFHASYWSNCFIKIYSFHLRVSLGHQMSLVGNHISLHISFIAEYRLCANDVLSFRSRYQGPDIIPLKLEQSIMHGLNLAFILESTLNLGGFTLQQIARIRHKVSKTFINCMLSQFKFIHISHNNFRRVIQLNS